MMSYIIDFNSTLHSFTDALVLRNREVEFETFSSYFE